MHDDNQKNSGTHKYVLIERMLEQMPVGVALLDAQTLHLLTANAAFHEFLIPAWQGGWAIGHPVTDWLPLAEENGIVAVYRRVAATAIPYRSGEFRFYTREHDVTYWNWTVDPICDSDGQVVQLLTTASDITPHVQAHQRVEQARQKVEARRKRLETVLDQLPDGILLIDVMNGCIIYANAAAIGIAGVLATSLIGHPIDQVLQLFSAVEVDGQPVLPENFSLEGLRRGEIVRDRETMLTRPDGSKHIILSSAAPLYAEDGAIAEVAYVIQDITARKSVEQQKQEFFRIASHELLTPIAIIQGFAEVLKLQTCLGHSMDSAENHEAVTAIIGYSEHLTRLIDEMLDLAHIQCDQLLVNRVPHDLREVLSELIESQGITAKQHRLHFVLQGLQPADTLIACIDKDRVVQVVSNLINNAVKYSPVDSDVEIGLRYSQEQPGEALIWVKDQGVGIPARDVPHIFERFYRATNVDRSLRGFGVGLYLARELVMRHGGCIRAESTEGAGSTFYVTLPLDNCQADV